MFWQARFKELYLAYEADISKEDPCYDSQLRVLTEYDFNNNLYNSLFAKDHETYLKAFIQAKYNYEPKDSSDFHSECIDNQYLVFTRNKKIILIICDFPKFIERIGFDANAKYGEIYEQLFFKSLLFQIFQDLDFKNKDRGCWYLLKYLITLIESTSFVLDDILFLNSELAELNSLCLNCLTRISPGTYFCCPDHRGNFLRTEDLNIGINGSKVYAVVKDFIKKYNKVFLEFNTDNNSVLDMFGIEGINWFGYEGFKDLFYRHNLISENLKSILSNEYFKKKLKNFDENEIQVETSSESDRFGLKYLLKNSGVEHHQDILNSLIEQIPENIIKNFSPFVLELSFVAEAYVVIVNDLDDFIYFYNLVLHKIESKSKTELTIDKYFYYQKQIIKDLNQLIKPLSRFLERLDEVNMN